MDLNEVLGWVIVIPSALVIFWFMDKYGDSVNLFIDNQARRLECPLMSKLYVWVCWWFTLCCVVMFGYSVWWIFNNDYNLIVVLFWFYVWWVLSDWGRLYSDEGRCKHKDWQVVIGAEMDGIISNAFNDRGEISAWCPDCGALEIDSVWTNPRVIRKKFKDIRGVE